MLEIIIVGVIIYFVYAIFFRDDLIPYGQKKSDIQTDKTYQEEMKRVDLIFKQLPGKVKNKIPILLKKRGEKLTAKSVHTFLINLPENVEIKNDIAMGRDPWNKIITQYDGDGGSFDIEAVKEACEVLYVGGKISKTGNGRYFVPVTKEKKTKVNLEKELESLKRMLDKDLITKDEYESMRKDLLGS